ncbi:MAG: hypothetical protein JXR68_12130 [Bacteroidales bacterium]|nr:hypothetical protein [Bacteroidales bacterium]
MAKKNSLFKTKKEIEKTFQISAMESLSAVGGALGSSMLFNTVRSKIENETIRRFGGAILAGGGIALNIAAKDANVKALSHGITAVGTLQAIQDLAPADMSSKFGLTPSISIEGIGATPGNVITDEELQRLAAEAEAEIMAELENKNDINGIEGEDENFEEIEAFEEIKGVSDLSKLI